MDRTSNPAELDSGIAIRRISLLAAVGGAFRQSRRNALHFLWILPLALQGLGWANSLDPNRGGMGRFEVRLRPFRQWTFDSGDIPGRSNVRRRYVCLGGLEFDQYEKLQYVPHDCPPPILILQSLRSYFPHPW